MSIHIKTGTAANGFNRVSEAYVRTADNPTGARVLDGWVCTAVTDGVPTEWLSVFHADTEEDWLRIRVLPGTGIMYSDMVSENNNQTPSAPYKSSPAITIHPVDPDVLVVVSSGTTITTAMKIYYYRMSTRQVIASRTLLSNSPIDGPYHGYDTSLYFQRHRNILRTHVFKYNNTWKLLIFSGLAEHVGVYDTGWIFSDWKYRSPISAYLSGTFKDGNDTINYSGRGFGPILIGTKYFGSEVIDITSPETILAGPTILNPYSAKSYLGPFDKTTTSSPTNLSGVRTYLEEAYKLIGSFGTGSISNSVKDPLIRRISPTDGEPITPHPTISNYSISPWKADGAGAQNISKYLHADTVSTLMPGQRTLIFRTGNYDMARPHQWTYCGFRWNSIAGFTDPAGLLRYTGSQTMTSWTDVRNRMSNSSYSNVFEIDGVPHLMITTFTRANYVSGTVGGTPIYPMTTTVNAAGKHSCVITCTIYNLERAMASETGTTYVPWWHIIRGHHVEYYDGTDVQGRITPTDRLSVWETGITSKAYVTESTGGNVVIKADIRGLNHNSSNPIVIEMECTFNKTPPSAHPTGMPKLIAGGYSAAYQVGTWSVSQFKYAGTSLQLLDAYPHGWNDHVRMFIDTVTTSVVDVNATHSNDSTTFQSGCGFIMPGAAEYPYGYVRVYSRLGKVYVKVNRFKTYVGPNTGETSDEIEIADYSEFNYTLQAVGSNRRKMSYRNITIGCEFLSNASAEGVPAYIAIMLLKGDKLDDDESAVIARIDIKTLFPTPF